MPFDHVNQPSQQQQNHAKSNAIAMLERWKNECSDSAAGWGISPDDCEQALEFIRQKAKEGSFREIA